jgi:hypothetical protein
MGAVLGGEAKRDEPGALTAHKHCSVPDTFSQYLREPYPRYR